MGEVRNGVLRSISLSKDSRMVGREKEYNALSTALAAGRNAVVVGEPGAGRKTLVQSTIMFREIDWRVYAASSSSYAEFVEKFKEGVNSPEALFIDGLDLLAVMCMNPGLLFADASHDGGLGPLEYLKEISAKDWQIVVTTTEKEVEKTLAYLDNAYVVRVSPLNVDRTLDVLRRTRTQLEAAHNARISDAALIAAAQLSERYIPSGVQPQKSIGLLKEACYLGSGTDPLITDEAVFYLISKWTRIPPSRLRFNKQPKGSPVRKSHRLAKRVMSVGNLKRLDRAFSELDLSDLATRRGRVESRLPSCSPYGGSGEEIARSPDKPIPI